MKNLFKMAAVLVVMLGMVGCASIGSVSNKMVDNQQGGIIYGAAWEAYATTPQIICESIKNKDYRCSKPDEYKVVTIYSKFGFSDGAVGINALVRKDFPNLSKLRNEYTTRDGKKLAYVKARVIAGQLGELLEIIQTDGNGDCDWSGLPRAGGVVCPGKYDYRKDFQGVVFR